MTDEPARPGLVRRAWPDDARELTRLRALMLGSLDGSSPGLDEAWAQRCEAELRRRLLPGAPLVAMVVDAPDGSGLASAGVGVVDFRLPAPGRLSPAVGHVSSMSTDPQWRRRGYARAVLDALVVWLRAEGCARIELFASDDGLPLYEDNGFRLAPNPSLRRTLP